MVPKRCPILGIPLVFSSSQLPQSPSLDRIDNRLGYVPGNVQVVSWRANELKKDATPRELIALGRFASNLANRKSK